MWQKLGMKICVALTLVVWSASAASHLSKRGTANPDHFTTVCHNESSATISVDDKFVAEGLQPCNLTKGTGNDYILSKNCFPDKAFVIKGEVESALISRNVFTLKCSGDRDGVKEKVTEKILVQTTNVAPAGETATFTQATIPLQLMLLNTKPSASNVNKDMTNLQVKQATLGQKLYLSIVNKKSSKPGIPYLIPLSCNATGTGTRLPLWSLHKKGEPGKCFKEVVMSTNFEYVETSKSDCAYAEMQAFQFEGYPDGTITFECEVRVCLDKKQNSKCSVEYGERDCSKSRRRRRDVIDQDDGQDEQGKLHHLTATLHIRNDIMLTGVSSRVYYTVTCLILPVLAMVVL